MKKKYILSLIIIIFMIIFIFSFIGFSKPKQSINIKNSDSISIFYGFSSYAMFSHNQDTIKTLSDCFNNLSFEPTDEKMDISTMFMICFSKGENQIAKVSVDKNGIFWLNDDTECLKLSSGTFDYNDIHDIYIRSPKK